MNDSFAGNLLRRARRAAGRTQDELAREAGVPQSVLSAYERGRRQPSVAALVRILRAAGFRLAVRQAPDDARAGRVLPQLLDLADALPKRTAGELSYPRLP